MEPEENEAPVVERRDVFRQIQEVARSLAQPEIPVRARPRERSRDSEPAERLVAAPDLVQGFSRRDRDGDHARRAGRQRKRRAGEGIDPAARLGRPFDPPALRNRLRSGSLVRSAGSDSPERDARAVRGLHVDEDEAPRGVLDEPAGGALAERGLVRLASGEPQIVVEEKPQVAEPL
ncbi:MAG: hypothetical protein E6J13_15145 [Chloroflexi bacterium]|nr:MAG: hypothetical protein E6J13_15145 [Chloroflexota bacterium]